MNRARTWLRRLAGLFVRQRRERELAAELESHLALHIDDNVRAGMTPEEARRQALIKLGGLEQVKERYRDQRGIPWLENFLGDLRHAARALARNPGSALATILLLALGMGGVSALFGPLYSLVLSPLPFPHSGRLVRIGGNIPIFNGYTARFVHRASIRSVFSSVAAYETEPAGAPIVLSSGSRPVMLHVTSVTPGFFATLGVPPMLGKDFAGKDRTAPVVVVSYRLWRGALHGARNVIGSSIRLSGSFPFVVAGVMPPGFDFPSGTDIWLPMAAVYIGRFQLLGRLRPGLPLDSAATELKTIVHGGAPGAMWNSGPVLESLHDYLLGDRRPLLWTLWSISLLFLLLACAGAANLLLARGVQRRPEMVVCLTLGAGRARLIRQLLTETLLLAAAGGLLGLGIAAAGARWIGSLLPAAQGAKSFSLAGLGLAVLLAVVATILCGLAPAFHATGGDLNAFLKTGTSGITASSPRRHFFSSHELLAGGQLVLAMILLISTGLLLRSLVARLQFPLGFQPRNVAVVAAGPLPAFPALVKARRNYFKEHHLKRYQVLVGKAVADLLRAIKPERDAELARNQQFYREARQRLARLPGVASVGVMSPPPLTSAAASSSNNLFAVPKRFTPVLPAPNVPWVGAMQVAATPDSFRILGIQFLSGRTFSKADLAQELKSQEKIRATNQGRTGVAIINEALAKAFWPNENPIGHQFHPSGVERSVVGVVSNIHESGENPKIVPTYYVPFAPIRRWVAFIVRLRPGTSMDRFSAAAHLALTRLSPDIPSPSVFSLQIPLGNLRLALALLSCFSLLGTVVAGLGVYATATVMAAARTREIGVRLALGAHPEQIRRLAVWRSVRLALVAFPFGALGSWLLALSLSHWLFHVGAADPLSYLSSAALLAVIVLAAGLIPARHAARVDPVVALREE